MAGPSSSKTLSAVPHPTENRVGAAAIATALPAQRGSHAASPAVDGPFLEPPRLPGRVTAVVWTADCSATVDLSRLAGPLTGRWQIPQRLGHLPCSDSGGRCDFNRTRCVTGLYSRCLTAGSQFDIYEWVNLFNLARLWDQLLLPRGLRAEWAGALRSWGALALPPSAASLQ